MAVHVAASRIEVTEFRRNHAQIRSAMVTRKTMLRVTSQTVPETFTVSEFMLRV
jgi:hypothetical protein